MIRKPLFLSFFLVLLVAAPASADYARKGERCKRVVFTPQSDDVADYIYKRGVTCKRARRVVRIVRRKGDMTPLGFTCKSRAHNPQGLSHTDFVCRGAGKRRVSWAQY